MTSEFSPELVVREIDAASRVAARVPERITTNRDGMLMLRRYAMQWPEFRDVEMALPMTYLGLSLSLDEDQVAPFRVHYVDGTYGDIE